MLVLLKNTKSTMRNVNTASLRLDYVRCNLANIRLWTQNQKSVETTHHFAEYSVRIYFFTLLNVN